MLRVKTRRGTQPGLTKLISVNVHRRMAHGLIFTEQRSLATRECVSTTYNHHVSVNNVLSQFMVRHVAVPVLKDYLPLCVFSIRSIAFGLQYIPATRQRYVLTRSIYNLDM